MSLETLGALIVALCAGIALAAAAGLRAFLPLLVLAVGARMGLVDLHHRVAFLESDIALVALILATLLETGADKIPLLDHGLDAVGTFVRPVVGFLAGLAVLADVPQPLAIGLALVLAMLTLGTHLEHAKVRAGSTVTTAGIGNPILSVIEDVVAGVLSVLAVLAPLVAGLLVLGGAFLLWRLVRGLWRSRHPVPVRGSEP
jgi:hypothetical protein